jgi:NapC/NirT cytochrome c family, N-terminal region
VGDRGHRSPERDRHPVLLFFSHWVSLLGAGIVTTAVISWLLIQLGGMGQDNPYLGMLTALLIPAVFFIGLILMPLGFWLARRRGETAIVNRPFPWRRLAMFLGITTVANVLLATQFTYRAVEHLSTRQFCGQSCHVMLPQFRAAQVASHAKVDCVACHIAPGAEGFIAAKLAGTRQLYHVMRDSYPRPVPPALESGRLVPASQTCEHCHDRGNEIGNRLRVIPKYAADEANSLSYTVLLIHAGGGGSGIHGAHLNPDVRISFSAKDAMRQEIPWVRWRNQKTGEERLYTQKGAGPIPGGQAEIEMQCVDCHNRPAHTFESADAALNRALFSGEISPTLPGVKGKALELLTAEYPSQEEALRALPSRLAEHYKTNHAALYGSREAEIRRAGETIAAIYARNVFPDLNVKWGTYTDNRGHTASPGCFRCHGGDHSTAKGEALTGDCASCHEMPAMEEAAPEILKSLNLLK